MISWWPRGHKEIFDGSSKEQREQLNNYLKNGSPEPERTYLSIGPTSKGRVSLKIGYSEVTMDLVGLESLIGTLDAAKGWITPSLDDSGKQPDNGCQEVEKPV